MVETETRIYVNNDLDIVMARMQAREIAKKMGFSTADQARISLAASELARVLSWINQETTELVISSARKNDREGLQVVCLVQREYLPENNASATGSDESVPSRSLAGACKLVDESIFEPHNEELARVTLIKWLRVYP